MYNVYISDEEGVMQNRYTADIGDFGKFGLLREIDKSKIKIGVNWYLVPNESHNGDGKFINYFNNKIYDGCDNILRESLKSIIYSNERSVTKIEEVNLLENGKYYNRILKSPMQSGKDFREKWHKDALNYLSECDVVFLDPDNGLLTKSVSKGSGKSIKFVFEDEIVDYYKRGQSVIFYNHRCREKEGVYLKRFEQLFERDELKDASKLGISFKRCTIRDYIHIIQPKHHEIIIGCINNLFATSWKTHFERLF